VFDEQHDDDTGGDADGKSRDIDSGVKLVPDVIAQGEDDFVRI
jgi:hypothetical protein